jgi:ribose transport system permease protein
MTESPAQPHKNRTGQNLRRVLEAFGPVLGLILVVVIFSSARGFLTPVNANIVLTQTVIVALASIGMTMVIVGGGIDLSVGSVVALCAVVGAVAVKAGWPTPAVVLAALLAGAVCGLLNGVVIARFGMAPFIVTLGMMGVARGVAKWLGRNQSVNYPPDHLINRLMNNPGRFQEWDVPLWLPPPGVLIALFAAGLMTLVLARTIFGRRVYALGSNEAAARLCGIPTRMLKIQLYMLAGVFYGLAGVMQLSRLQQGDPTVAIGLELDVIAAVVIGGASLAGGTGSIPGAMVGALIMAVLRNGSDQMGWESYVQEIMIGCVIIFAVGLDKLRRGWA